MMYEKLGSCCFLGDHDPSLQRLFNLNPSFISLPKPHPGMIFNEPFKSPENLTPEQSEGDPEPVELLSDEPSDWAAWEFANDQAEQ